MEYIPLITLAINILLVVVFIPLVKYASKNQAKTEAYKAVENCPHSGTYKEFSDFKLQYAKENTSIEERLNSKEDRLAKLENLFEKLDNKVDKLPGKIDKLMRKNLKKNSDKNKK